MESIADPSSLEGLEDDPKALGQVMRKMRGKADPNIAREILEELLAA